MWLGTWRWGGHPAPVSGPSVVTRVLTSRGEGVKAGEQPWQQQQRLDQGSLETRGGVTAKECRQPLEAGKRGQFYTPRTSRMNETLPTS